MDIILSRNDTDSTKIELIKYAGYDEEIPVVLAVIHIDDLDGDIQKHFRGDKGRKNYLVLVCELVVKHVV